MSNSGDVNVTAYCCTFGQRQGHAGDVIAGAKWAMPTDSCFTTDGEIGPEAAGYPMHTQAKCSTEHKVF